MKEGTEGRLPEIFSARNWEANGETTIFCFCRSQEIASRPVIRPKCSRRCKDTALTLIFRGRQQQSPLLPTRHQRWLRCLPCKLITRRAISVCRDIHTLAPHTPPSLSSEPSTPITSTSVTPSFLSAGVCEAGRFQTPESRRTGLFCFRVLAPFS